MICIICIGLFSRKIVVNQSHDVNHDVNIFHGSIYTSLLFGGKNITKYSCSLSQKALSRQGNLFSVERVK